MKNVGFAKTWLLPLTLCALGLVSGIFGGFVGAAFSFVLSFVTHLRGAKPWLLLFLPVGGVATVLLYRRFAGERHHGTNEMILCLKNESRIHPVLAPLIFLSTAITHLFGGSAGREGAALQLGGAGASAISDLLKLNGITRTVFVMSGMSAVFASVFGTPLTAAFFLLEFKSSKRTVSLALLPCLISSIVAKTCASLLGVVEHTMHLDHAVPFSLASCGKVLVLTVGLSLLGKAMCFVFAKAQLWAKQIVKNTLVRAVVFAVAVVVLTVCVGDMRYNGSGMDMAIRAVSGDAAWFDFLLKLLFTAVTLAAGFKGGEIIPTFCIGATFGCFFGGVLGLDVGLAAALGAVGLFCCATNSCISAVFLGIELFGFAETPYVLIICVVLWLLSTNEGLFKNRFFTAPMLGKRKHDSQVV